MCMSTTAKLQKRFPIRPFRDLLRKALFVFRGKPFLRTNIPSGRDVVNDLGAGFERRVGDGRAVRVHRNGNVDRAFERGNCRRNATQLFRFVDRRASGPRRFPSHVEYSGAVAHELSRRVGERVKIDVEPRRRFRKTAAVGKTVGSYV